VIGEIWGREWIWGEGEGTGNALDGLSNLDKAKCVETLDIVSTCLCVAGTMISLHFFFLTKEEARE
jgi:hypothetical protein